MWNVSVGYDRVFPSEGGAGQDNRHEFDLLLQNSVFTNNQYYIKLLSLYNTEDFAFVNEINDLDDFENIILYCLLFRMIEKLFESMSICLKTISTLQIGQMLSLLIQSTVFQSISTDMMS